MQVTLPDLPLDWRIDQIKGYEYVKRAIEVACAGGHSLGIIAEDPTHDHNLLAAWANAHGAKALAVLPCPCGHWGSERLECTCTTSLKIRHEKGKHWQWAHAADMNVPAAAAPFYKVSDPRHCEPDEAILERIARCKATPRWLNVPDLDSTALSLLGAAMRHFNVPVSSYRYQQLLAVGQTIAKLCGESRIGVAHIAEAIQYTPKPLTEFQEAPVPE